MNFLMYYMHLVVTAWAKRYDFKTDLILKHIKNCVNIFMPSDPYRSVAISNLYCTELIFREILAECGINYAARARTTSAVQIRRAAVLCTIQVLIRILNNSPE